MWACGYFVAASGNITEEMSMLYIENLDDNSKEDRDCTIAN